MNFFIQIRLLMIVILLVSVHLSRSTAEKKLHDKINDIILYVYLIHNALIFPVFFASIVKYGYIDLMAPFSLIYGPLIYFYYRAAKYNKLEIRKIIFHLLPVLGAFIFYFIFILNSKLRNSYSQVYILFEFGLIGLSLIGYCGTILVKEKLQVEIMSRVKYFAGYCVLTGFFMLFIVFLGILDFSPVHQTSSESGMISVAIFMFVGAAILLADNHRRFREQFEPKKRFSNMSYTTALPHKQKPVSFVNLPKKDQSIEFFFKSDYIRNPELKLSEVATVLGIKESDLQKYFRKYYNQPFSKFLVSKRIDLACELLLLPDFNPEYDLLAEDCGFQSKATFYRNFKRLKGCSPSKFREKKFKLQEK